MAPPPLPITLLPEGCNPHSEGLGLIVKFDPSRYPQLRQVGRKFLHYDIERGSLDLASLPPAALEDHFSIVWMAVTVEKGYADFPYQGGDFGLSAMADSHDEEYMLHLDFDSVPLDPLEPYHEGLLKVRLQPFSRDRLYDMLWRWEQGGLRVSLRSRL